MEREGEREGKGDEGGEEGGRRVVTLVYSSSFWDFMSGGVSSHVLTFPLSSLFLPYFSSFFFRYV